MQRYIVPGVKSLKQTFIIICAHTFDYLFERDALYHIVIMMFPLVPVEAAFGELAEKLCQPVCFHLAVVIFDETASGDVV